MVDGPQSTPTRPPRRGWTPGRFDWMIVFPVAAAVAWWLDEDVLALILVAILPACMILDGRHARGGKRVESSGEPAARTVPSPVRARAAIRRVIDDVLEDCERRDRTTAILHVQIDDLHVADGEWGVEAEARIMERVMQRVRTTMRGLDEVMRAADDAIIVVLAPTRRTDLDVVMGVVDRLQVAIAEPFSIGGRAIRVHSCIGLCSEAMAPSRTGAAMLAAADCALRIARRQGIDAVRAFNPDMREQVETDHRLASQVEAALAAGEIRAWFQPQVESASGKLAGFEALARWHHPELGVLTPDRFLATLTATGRSAELGERILEGSLDAIQAWDAAGFDVPCVGVNVSLEQLCDPRLADRIIWQLDRRDIPASRIAIEILETVTLRGGDETIMRNVRALREAGFRLDLDDFGTGAASIAHIARFGVHRIKIDRSFVSGIDLDPTQRELVAAILGLAERLRIATLAEGVETPGERATLTALGCPHLQGFGIARPMPFEDTIEWCGRSPAEAQPSLASMVPRGTA